MGQCHGGCGRRSAAVHAADVQAPAHDGSGKCHALRQGEAAGAGAGAPAHAGRTTPCSTAGPPATTRCDGDAAAVLQFTVEMWRAAAAEALATMLAAPPAIRRHFDAFMAGEHNANHVAFCDEVELLKADVDGEAAWTRAQAIYDRYVAAGGAEEVNLPTRFRRGGFDAGQHVDLLVQAQAEVMSMMALDAFPRFLRSRQCDAMLEELAAQPEVEWMGATPPGLSSGSGILLSHASMSGSGGMLGGKGGEVGVAEAVSGDAPMGGGGHPPSPPSLHAGASPGSGAGGREMEARWAGGKGGAGMWALPWGEAGSDGMEGKGARSSDSSQVYGSRGLASNLRAARANLTRGKGRWMDVFASVADVLPVCIVIADMRLPSAPIVYANAAFYATTGYQASQVLGRNCRFLQGPGTDLATVDKLRQAIRLGQEVHCEILNYRRDGTPFRNFLSMMPVWDRLAPPLTAPAPPPAGGTVGAVTSECGRATGAAAMPQSSCQGVAAVEEEEAGDGAVGQGSAVDRPKLAYFIGVQFEVTDDSLVPAKLVRHDALMRMLPRSVAI